MHTPDRFWAPLINSRVERDLCARVCGQNRDAIMCDDNILATRARSSVHSASYIACQESPTFSAITVCAEALRLTAAKSTSASVCKNVLTKRLALTKHFFDYLFWFCTKDIDYLFVS